MGKVFVVVLGCPNYPLNKDFINYHHDKMSRLSLHLGERLCVKFEWPNFAKLVKVSSIDDPALATFREPVERANTSHTFSAGVANSVGLRKQPLRVHCIVKYAAIARGDAEVFMSLQGLDIKKKYGIMLPVFSLHMRRSGYVPVDDFPNKVHVP
ncbi:hypothetical protein RJ641_034471 [Dillenia turbinata]|uniref:Uncharacterized protein n=1 Tax=Dillenia turbinata TaxID=194707 RepID=A0AAN8VR82_9MAGN